MNTKSESWLVKKIKYFESNYHHIYKNYEALFFFILSIFFLSGFTHLKDNIIKLWSSLFNKDEEFSDLIQYIVDILSSVSFYVILFFFIISYFITKKITRQSHSQETEIERLKIELTQSNRAASEIKNQLNEAEEAIDELKNSNLITSFEIGSKFIAYIFTKFGLTSRERVSLYLKTNGHFILAARYSLDSRFAEVHRKEFSIEQGVIGECWRLNRRILKHLPKNDAPYIKETVKQNFTEAEIKSFTMKSRSLIAIPIHRDNFELIGVMVVESTKEQWDFDEDCTLTDEYHTLFRQFLIHYEKTINACQREVVE